MITLKIMTERETEREREGGREGGREGYEEGDVDLWRRRVAKAWVG